MPFWRAGPPRCRLRNRPPYRGAAGKWYDCTGLDRSPSMLRIARRRLPRVAFKLGSMEEFSLGRQFDVITCLFGVLGYARTVERMSRAIANMAAHLRPGGALLVAPWYSPEQWTGRFVRGRVGQAPGITVARVTRSWKRNPRLSHFESHYLVGRKQGIAHVVETQELGLFHDREVQRAFRQAGLRGRHLRKFGGSANGLHLGNKPLG
ncbi:MAG TPA: methyltransferase domain-containing protein [Thermoplasmata archaeon]|nr:methyltransferase domain-containing protein [Thermoplasmata archaeon]